MDAARSLCVAVLLFVLCHTVSCQEVEGGSNDTSPLLGDDCTEDEECSGTEPASSCRGNTCVACADATKAYQEYLNCTDKHGCALHEYDKKCWKIRDIGESCSVHEECWIYPTANITRLCNDDICVCNEADDYYYISSNKFGVDKCMANVILPPKDSSAEKAGSSYLWSALVALLITILGAMTNV